MYTYDVYIYVKKTCALHNIKSLFYRKPPKSPVVSKNLETSLQLSGNW